MEGKREVGVKKGTSEGGHERGGRKKGGEGREV